MGAVCVLIGLAIIGLPILWGSGSLTSLLLGSLVIGLSLVLTRILTLPGLLQMKPAQRLGRVLLYLGLGAVGLLIAGVVEVTMWVDTYTYNDFPENPTTPLINAAKTICGGHPLEVAAYRPTGSRPRPMVVLVDGANRTPAQVLPKALGELELVACGKATTRVVGTCTYSDTRNTATRKVESLQVRIIGARDGQELAAFQLEGPQPPPCPGSIKDVLTSFDLVTPVTGAEIVAKFNP